MIHLKHKDRAFAVLLAAVAGYVDAVGFLKTGGYFVSFMSGNSTRLAVNLVSDRHTAAVAMGLIGSFVIGVTTGTLVSGHEGRRSGAVLRLVAASLAVSAGVDCLGFPLLGIFAAATAMGAENVTIVRGDDVQVGVTYMTGTLVKLGQRLARTLQGRSQDNWLPFLLLWGGLIGGGILGTIIFQFMAFAALWLAVATTAILSLYNLQIHPEG